MFQQTRIDSFFPIVKGTNGKKNPKQTPSKMKRKLPHSGSSMTKTRKIHSPTKKLVKIYPSTEKLSPSNENLPQESTNISQSEIFCTPEKSNNSFTPKKSPRSSSASQLAKKFSPRKLFEDTRDLESIRNAIENLNLTKQGAIGPNDFHLEKIYASQKWDIEYKSLKTDVVHQYEIKDVIFPNEKHADHLFTIIVDVFSNAINCGYFDEKELDFLFSVLTLTAKSQMLLARLLKRKITWHRISGIQYPEIDENLSTFFQELVDKGFCISTIETEEVPNLLRLLQLDEIRKLCQNLKVKHRGSKATMMEKLLELNNKQKSWFVGAKSPSTILKSSIFKALGSCVKLAEETMKIFERLFILLIPCQDPSESISDLFLMLERIKNEEILFPTTPKERFPIFRNRDHLLGFVEARNVLKEQLEAIERKDWETVKKFGNLAYDRLFPFVKDEEESSLPSHIKKFFPLSVWTKILSKSIEAFKKTPETMEDAVKYLRALINENKFGKSYLGRWYRELSLIEMHHRKDLQTSATLTLEALSMENLTEVDVKELLERAKKLMRRKSGINEETKMLIRDVLETIQRELPAEFDIVTEIEAYMVQGNETGSKSTWRIDIGEGKGYTRVEQIALRHYYKEGFPRGFHCEGSLPLSLFTVLFWSELYDIPVPGAFVSAYQESPLDLYTSKFFDNRKEKLESKITFLRALDNETFAETLCDDFIKYRNFRSTISSNLFETEEHFKEVVKSLGTTGVVGICERLASNFTLWKAGFPDLCVWNPLTNECKIVEVKGPGDSLSSKQKLWLQYLQRIGITAEVCIVKAKGKS